MRVTLWLCFLIYGLKRRRGHICGAILALRFDERAAAPSERGPTNYDQQR